MSIENPAVIDAMGINSISGDVVLGISDHLSWDELVSHAKLLEAKINEYIWFVSSGQLAKAMPEATGRKVCIGLIHQFEPTLDAMAALSSTTNQLAELGIRFAHRSLPPLN